MESLCIAGGNVKWYSHHGKLYGVVWWFLKKLNTESPFPSSVAFLGIYLEELKVRTQTGICTPMFIAVLFIIAKIQNNLKAPSTDE